LTDEKMAKCVLYLVNVYISPFKNLSFSSSAGDIMKIREKYYVVKNTILKKLGWVCIGEKRLK
jgi:hypothetical protein